MLRHLIHFNQQQHQHPSRRTSGPRSLSHLLTGLAQHARVLQLMLLAVGLLGLCLVPLLERKIDFDENALLAGSARPTIR